MYLEHQSGDPQKASWDGEAELAEIALSGAIIGLFGVQADEIKVEYQLESRRIRGYQFAKQVTAKWSLELESVGLEVSMITSRGDYGFGERDDEIGVYVYWHCGGVDEEFEGSLAGLKRRMGVQ